MAEPMFALTQSPQTKSRLLRLPDEIITKILRYALKRPDPVQTLKARQTAEDDGSELISVDMFLSSQILRVCQTLMRLSLEISLRQNTLSISF